MAGNIQLSDFIQQLPIGVLIAKTVHQDNDNVDFKIESANQKGLEFFSVQRNALLGKLISEVMPQVHEQAIEWLKRFEEQPSVLLQHDFAFVLVNSSAIAQARMFFTKEGNLCIMVYQQVLDVSRCDEDLDENAYATRMSNEQEILINISMLLMRATPNNLVSVVQSTMEEAAKIATADRVYVFDYNFDKRSSNNIYEWCSNGITPQIETLQGVPFENIQEWLDVHLNNDSVIIHDLSKLPDGNPVKEALTPQDIKSVIAVPLFFEEQLFGFIGFDSVREKHQYSAREEQILRQYGNNLLSTLMRIKFEQALLESEADFRVERDLYYTTLSSIEEGVASINKHGIVVFANKAFEKMTGYTTKDIEGEALGRVLQIVSEKDYERLEVQTDYVITTGRSIVSEEHVALRSNNGMDCPVEYNITPVLDSTGVSSGAVITIRDVTERRLAQKQIEHISRHDALTGLLNRYSFGELIAKESWKSQLPMSVLIVDINGLKLTNDAFGYTSGDSLIIEVSDILKASCLGSSSVFRLGGDKFIVLLPGTESMEANLIKQRIYNLASERSKENMIISIAVGAGSIVDLGQDIQAAIKDAESDMYRDKIISGRSMRRNTIELIVDSINTRYHQEQIHTDRVAKFCEQIGKALGMSDSELKSLVHAGSLHDIGKVIIPQDVLCKKGALTSEEYNIVKRHSETGYQILRAVDDLAAYAEAVLYHHERWDGCGYPQGLRGEEIPLFSRIIAVADSFEAMTANRIYREHLSTEEAILELEANAGKQFDPSIVDVFVGICKEEPRKLTD